MAKNPTPQNDPAALAFSAVEDALKDSVFSLDSPAQQPADKKPADSARSERLRAADKIAQQAGSVANDDRFPTSKILYNLQNRSSSTPTWIALVLSIVWLAVAGTVAWLRYGPQLANFGQFVGTIDFIGVLAIMILPVLGFFAVATLFRRAQDLRNAASSITQAAIRLAEPEVTAADKVASVGQAVRREVNALGDGLERALSRAGELEVMIHNEVTALERTYSDNESRMRALIAELASQRESVLTNTERVREAITESHTGLVFDLDMISQRIAGTIVESGGNLTRALETAGNTLTNSFGERTDSFVSLVDNRTTDFITSLDNSANRLSLTFEDQTGAMARSLDERAAELNAGVESRIASLTGALDAHSASIADAIDSRTQQIEQRTATLTGSFEERTQTIAGLIEARTGELASALDDRTLTLSTLLTDGGASLLEQLRERGHEVTGGLDMIGQRIAEDISSRSREAEVLLNALTRQLDESVSIQLNAMDSRLQSAVIEINGALDDTSERARITLATAGQDSLSQFDVRLNEIAAILDTRLHTLDNVIGDKGDSLIARLEEQGTSFAARANVLELALNEESGRFDDAVAERTRELGEVLGARTKAITESLTNRTREISDSLEGHAGIIAEALDGRTRAVDELLAARTTEMSEAIRARSEELGETLTGSTSAFDQAIAGRTQRLADTLTEKTTALSLELDSRTGTLASQLDDRTTALVAQIGERTTTLTGELDSRADELRSALDGGTQQLAQAVGTRTQQLSEALGSRTQALSDTLATHTASIGETIGLRTSELADTIAQQGEEARAKIDGSLRTATDAMGERVTTMSSLITDKVAELNSNLGTGLDSAIARISDAEHGVAARIDAASATVSESARQAADLIETGVTSARQAISDMVDQRLGTLPEAITARADITAERLAALNASINTSITQSMADLEAGADRIEETIATRITAATQNISTDISNTANRMDSAVRTALEQIRVAAGDIDQLLTVKAVGAVDTIETRLSDINRSVEHHTSAFAALVSEKSEQLQGALNSHGNLLRDALGDNAREAEAIMAVSTSRILTDVTAALGKLNDSNLLLQRVLDASTANLANLETSVAQQTSTYSTTVREAIGQTEQAGAMVSQHVSALQTTIRGMVDEFSTVLGRLDSEAANMSQASNALALTSDEALQTLEDRRTAMDSLAQSFASRADDIDGRMRLFAQSIADTVNDTERRLIGARRAMDEALTATTGSIAETIKSSTDSVTDALYATNERFTTTLSTNASQVDSAVQRAADAAAAALSQTASSVRMALNDQTAQVNNALEDNANKVSDVLAATASNVTDVLTTTTSTLADTISDSSVSVRNAIASNAGQLRNAIDQTTGTFRQALDETSGEVTSRLGEFRGAADAEGRRANAALQQAQQMMVGEMQRAIEEATLRFNDTARAMRETAREVGTELEATRAELARGVNELPEETRASAAAMRRVVAEQIEALSELNAIVRSQPATHDLNDRRPSRPVPRAETRQEPPAYQAPRDTYREEPARQTTTLIDPIRTAEPARHAEPLRQPEPQPEVEPAEAPAATDNGGWLRDVLRNATAKQQGTQPQQVGLSGLTDEIARSIDDGALADAWARYQAGESNVFSRRIYTLSGQGTYDEVRKKLQREPEFARTAQAYMSEFEQLLKRAAAGAHPAAETREYLLSDRGKVYTTLAHASGRLN
ncbi:apolipoprotein A1/A4/E domain-containing protein [Devosia sp. Root635]|uniref:apolipoprotein A1/A4/E domain-containing protein n=1 Tax=Devosia sp. Root635 TaxID=1736575 RepID=UPI0006F2BF71|nr:apolipoprotein A1/A4/E domain-containing protein [Devosia sp. Root635]KRA45531.1 hypothetical protein ASD80_04140 [Devosia sp. Root635]